MFCVLCLLMLTGACFVQIVGVFLVLTKNAVELFGSKQPEDVLDVIVQAVF